MPRARRPPEKRYDKKVAVVTGASSGIGRRLAVDLAARGATVVGVARREVLLAELEADLQRRSGAGATRVCDLADPAAFVELLGKVEEEHGRIDVLVNDAGTEALTPALPYTLSSSGTPEKQGSTATRLSGGVPTEYRYVLEVNFFAAVEGH
ncbi:MAG: SDR family oxidoreductase, partial [Actinobacteria bacterium]|nr:SDR family oxidoreductase [Actinomycetota bacterium]